MKILVQTIGVLYAVGILVAFTFPFNKYSIRFEPKETPKIVGSITVYESPNNTSAANNISLVPGKVIKLHETCSFYFISLTDANNDSLNGYILKEAIVPEEVIMEKASDYWIKYKCKEKVQPKSRPEWHDRMHPNKKPTYIPYDPNKKESPSEEEIRKIKFG